MPRPIRKNSDPDMPGDPPPGVSLAYWPPPFRRRNPSQPQPPKAPRRDTYRVTQDFMLPGWRWFPAGMLVHLDDEALAATAREHPDRFEAVTPPKPT